MQFDDGFNLLAFLVCDQVRKEASGKDIVIGVYTGNILVMQFPFQFELTCYAVYSSPPFESRDIALRVRNSDDTISLSVAGKIQADPLEGTDTAKESIVFPPLPIMIEKPEMLTFELKLGGGDWVEMDSKGISLIEAAKIETESSS